MQYLYSHPMSLITVTTNINSSPSDIWRHLTQPQLMKMWMGEPEMDLEIETQWKVGSPIVIRGFHHARFENRGVILRYEQNEVLQYTHLSSISRLKDLPENYSTTTFTLRPREVQTIMTVEVTGFPNESIFKHLNLYWTTTPAVIKKLVEERSA